MALAVTVTEYGHGTTTGHDHIALKVESETLGQSRSPIAIALPGGTLFGLDLGRTQPMISLTGIVDHKILEIPYTVGTGTFAISNTIVGDAALNTNITPARSVTPGNPTVVTVVGVTATSLFVTGMPSDTFFIDGETITGSGGATGTVNIPFPNIFRLRQVVQNWYISGKLTVVTNSGSFVVLPKNAQYSAEAGKEDRYTFKLDFVVVA
jgi:hypothetical protein